VLVLTVGLIRPRYYYWEGVDMIRKLILVGLISVVGRGSVAQLFIAVVVSVTLLALQLVLQPYKHPEDNQFKAGVEIHICLTVACALVLKCLRLQSADQEAVPVAFYDVVLVVSFIASIPLAFVWTVCAKRDMMRDSLKERAMSGDNSSTRAKQRAIKMLRLGLTTNDDMRLLAGYFGQLQNMVSKWSHVFISYRVASDRDLARRLHDSLATLTIEETGQKVRVYLDQTRLEDGQRWDSGFMEGLSKSWVFVPIVSVGSVQPMMNLSTSDDWCDNVLLEWTAALELYQRRTIKAVLPLLTGTNDFFADAQEAFGGVSALPTHVSTSTMEQVVMHLRENTGDASLSGLRELVQQAHGEPEPTIKHVVNSLLRFQGIKVTAGAAGTAHSHGHLSVGTDDMTDCIDRVHATVSAALKRVGMEQDRSSAAEDGLHAPSSSSSTVASRGRLGSLGSRLSSMRSPAGGNDGGGKRGGGGGASPVEVTFGGGDAGGTGLYLSSD